MDVTGLDRTQWAASGATRSGDEKTAVKINTEPLRTLSASTRGGPCPELERLSHLAGVDALSLTDNQIAEALFQMR